ncbi:ABC transporter substrate-binding protein [Bariatricus sp. HCP28S3_E4]|uniref:ABC transporter substrate-binding protein n=1 Tax=Lachnospiraceae TaxID=186803 RepID=UPI002A80CA11|nr:sugar ABC transporter substrate-binding protein [Anaerobutyricum hallii]MDY4578981.1 sugar ABC transporter substrate-binding protein [Anaerobutyricum hallii]
MKTKKIIASMMVAAMATTLVAGCGSKGQESTESSTDSGSKKITIATWNEPNSDEALNMYAQCEKALGVDLEVTVIPESDYSSKLNQMVATKDDSIDIYIIWECDIANFAAADGILPLDDYLADSDIDTNDFIEAVNTLSDGLGGTYGLPWCAATEIMYYNQDMFDAAGIEYPSNDWSYEEFKAAAEKLTQKDGDTTSVYGCDLPNVQTWWAGIGGAGDQVYDPATGKLVIGDGAEAFISDCADMVSKGVMPEPSSDTADLFAAGKAAMSWAGSWNIATYGDDLGFNWDIATIPTNKVKYNTLHTGFYTINANSKNADTAWSVIEYLMGEEGQTINSKASGNMSALMKIADEGAWKVESAKTIENWDAMTDSLAAGVFGYTCLPSGVTNNAISNFNSAVSGNMTPEEAVEKSCDYAAETIGY